MVPRESACPSTITFVVVHRFIHSTFFCSAVRAASFEVRRVVGEEHVGQRLLGIQLVERLAPEQFVLGRRRRLRCGRRRRRRRRRGGGVVGGRRRGAAAAAGAACGFFLAHAPAVSAATIRTAAHTCGICESSTLLLARRRRHVELGRTGAYRPVPHAVNFVTSNGSTSRSDGARRTRSFLVPGLPPIRGAARRARRCAAAPAPRILDCGCGTGHNSALLRQYGRAVGIDLTASGLAYAHSSGERAVAQASAAQPALRDAVVRRRDLVRRDLRARRRGRSGGALAEMFRVLRPGGHLVINVAAMDTAHREPLRARRRSPALQPGEPHRTG